MTNYLLEHFPFNWLEVIILLFLLSKQGDFSEVKVWRWKRIDRRLVVASNQTQNPIVQVVRYSIAAVPKLLVTEPFLKQTFHVEKYLMFSSICLCSIQYITNDRNTVVLGIIKFIYLHNKYTNNHSTVAVILLAWVFASGPPI